MSELLEGESESQGNEYETAEVADQHDRRDLGSLVFVPLGLALALQQL